MATIHIAYSYDMAPASFPTNPTDEVMPCCPGAYQLTSLFSTLGQPCNPQMQPVSNGAHRAIVCDHGGTGVSRQELQSSNNVLGSNPLWFEIFG